MLIPVTVVSDSDLIPVTDSDAIPITVGAKRRWRQQKLVLFPIRLDDRVMKTHRAWAAKIRRQKHIGDFRNWKDHGSFNRGFDPVLRDLRASGKGK